IAGIGGFVAPQASPITGNYITAATQEPIYAGMSELMRAYRRAAQKGTPILVGAGNLERLVNVLDLGCCNAGGTDFGRMRRNMRFQYYRDLDIENLLPANQFLMFAPGTMQFIPYLEYRGIFAKPIGNRVRGTLMDLTMPGMVYDFSLLPDECNET